jgi:hypothetical protein
VTGRLAAIRDEMRGPERIDERPDLAPSKRLANVFPTYRKGLHGPMAVAAIGIDVLRKHCPHADAWLARLESLINEP